ncbi:MAG: DUF58 domain-containing protein [Betaproteobacteria bacterium]|nr:DUF58 domain-containing protein [Betaproteobacteria bacterium]MBU6513815.1 DUF58 domain-containing protein [Betaproteobacteria bacterium]MDE1955256.1 DUF58 domain-containing protein [Betaproteobacteria bacterium]MDE2153219.1 DUF58 domain-containing protein [Betaproteobacteria bacterium]
MATPGSSIARRSPRERFARWAMARHAPGPSTLLGQRNVYILPTPAGWMFALTVLVLLLGSINYQLNLGYLFTFALAGSALMSMHVTHANLRGVRVSVAPAQEPELYAGRPASLALRLHAERGARWGLLARLDAGAAQAVDLQPGVDAQCALAWTPPRRGRTRWPALRLETRFPLGLWRAWSVWRPPGRLWVYPAPEQPCPPLPPARTQAGDGAALRSGAGDELDELRAWRDGDELRRVVWRKTRGEQRVVRAAGAASARTRLWLDWDAAAGAQDSEARLRRLSAWVLAARARELDYGLRMPGRALPPAAGDEHARACLRLLAAWGLPEETEHD